MENASSNKRIDWIDVAKGIAMLLVIIGHCRIGNLRGVIFSFHMPLFFICSGITLRASQTNEQFIRNTKRAFLFLVTNAFLIFFLQSVLQMIVDPVSIAASMSLPEYLSERISTFIAGSGAGLSYGSLTFGSLGKPWFLLALFWGRTLFDFLQLKCKRPVVFYSLIALLTIAGVCLGSFVWLPLSLDIAFAIQPFFLLGFLLRRVELTKKALVICAVSPVIWIGLLIGIFMVSTNYLELASRDYPIFPLCYICAAAGSFLVMAISILLSEHLKTLVLPLKILGKHSLILFWVHCLDYSIPCIARLHTLSSNDYVNAMLRVLVDCAGFAVVLLIIKLYRKTASRKS